MSRTGAPPHGGVAVMARVIPDRSRVVISVRDTRVGIPASALPSVFEMFRQLEATATPARGGLGLYVVR